MVVMNSSLYFKTGQPDTELLWATGPVNHVTNTELAESTECQTKLLMFYFNPADSIVADFGRRTVGLTSIFLTQPCIEGKEPDLREICERFFFLFLSPM